MNAVTVKRKNIVKSAYSSDLPNTEQVTSIATCNIKEKVGRVSNKFRSNRCIEEYKNALRLLSRYSMVLLLLTGFLPFYSPSLLVLPYPENNIIFENSYIKVEYLPAMLRYNISVFGIPLFYDSRITVKVNGTDIYPSLSFIGYSIMNEIVGGSSFKTLKITFLSETGVVEHYITLANENPVLISWISVRPKMNIILTDISPLCGFLIPYFREKIEIASKEYWVLPGHYRYGIQDEMYSPVLIRFSQGRASLDAVISSLTSDVGKFIFTLKTSDDQTPPGFYSLYSPDRVLIKENHTFYSDRIVFIFGNSFKSLLTLYSKHLIAFNTVSRKKYSEGCYTCSRGWISWAYYYDRITSNSLEREIRFIRDNLLNGGYRYIIIDDGWQRRDTSYPAAYDWVQLKASFGNLTRTISNAHKNGLKVIIWVAFTCYDQNSYLTKERPEMFLKQNGRVFIENNHAYLNISSQEGKKYLEDLFSYYKQIGVDGLTFDLATLQFIGPTIKLSSPEKNLTSVIVFNKFLELIDELAEKHDMIVFLKGSIEIPSLVKFSRCISSRVSWDVTYASGPSDLVGVLDSILKTSFWLEAIIAPDPDALITGQHEKLINNVWNSVQTNFSTVYYGDPYSKANLSLLNNYMVWDFAACPIEFSWFEVPPSISVAVKHLCSYETIYGLLLINSERTRRSISINFEDITNSKPPFIVFDPVTSSAEVVNMSLVSIGLEHYTSSLSYVVPLNFSRPTILQITGFLSVKNVSYFSNFSRLEFFVYSPYSINSSVKIFFNNKGVSNVYVNDKALSKDHYKTSNSISAINMQLKSGINKVTVYFTTFFISSYSYEADKIDRAVSSLKKDYGETTFYFLISFISALLAATLLYVISQTKQEPLNK